MNTQVLAPTPMEHAPNDKRAWYGSFLPVSTFCAFAAAAVVAYALEASLSAQTMADWAGACRSWTLRRWVWWGFTCA